MLMSIKLLWNDRQGKLIYQIQFCLQHFLQFHRNQIQLNLMLLLFYIYLVKSNRLVLIVILFYFRQIKNIS